MCIRDSISPRKKDISSSLVDAPVRLGTVSYTHLLFNIVVNREGVVFFFNFWDCYNFDLFNHILIRIIKAINCLDVVFGHDILRTLRCIDASSVDHTDAAPVIKRFFIVQKQDTGRNSGGVEAVSYTHLK